MERVAIRALGNLLAAAEPVGDDERLRGSLPNCGKQFQFANRDRHLVLLFFKPERTRHSAAPRSRRGKIYAHLPQDRLFIVHLHNGFVMAMSMNDGLRLQTRHLKIWGTL